MAFTSIATTHSTLYAFHAASRSLPRLSSISLIPAVRRHPSTLKGAGPASFLPIISAQASPVSGYVPEANFYKVEAILRPWRIPQVSSALLRLGIRGVTVSDVRGFGAQGGLAERFAGSEFAEGNFVRKVKMEIVVCKDQVEEVVQLILDEARTGEIGDGKIFLIPVADVIRVRTGERGEMGERMTGGLADMSSAGSASASASA